ncbi:MAG: hypothetical protein AAF790_04265 [Planctomycetota bacterium]
MANPPTSCEQAFAALTRGPFPNGLPADADIERHLAVCPDCWRLANALRPAGDLFREALSPGENRGLPSYWGDATPPAAVVQTQHRTGRGRTGSPRGPAPPAGGNGTDHAAGDTGGGAPAATPGFASLGALTTTRVRRSTLRRPALRRPPAASTAWRDLRQVAGLLALVTTAACGLAWVLG